MYKIFFSDPSDNSVANGVAALAEVPSSGTNTYIWWLKTACNSISRFKTPSNLSGYLQTCEIMHTQIKTTECIDNKTLLIYEFQLIIFRVLLKKIISKYLVSLKCLNSQAFKNIVSLEEIPLFSSMCHTHSCFCLTQNNLREYTQDNVYSNPSLGRDLGNCLPVSSESWLWNKCFYSHSPVRAMVLAWALCNQVREPLKVWKPCICMAMGQNRAEDNFHLAVRQE